MQVLSVACSIHNRMKEHDKNIDEKRQVKLRNVGEKNSRYFCSSRGVFLKRH